MPKLRFGRRVDELTERAKMITFPVDPPYGKVERDRDFFIDRLKDLVRHNFGYSAGSELKYDRDRGEFYFMREEMAGFMGATRVRVERTFHIDPRKNLADEFARVKAEIEEFGEHRHSIMAHVIKNGGEPL